MSRRLRIFLLGLVVAGQLFLSFQGIADEWLRGHNGWNGAAYEVASRNSLRWGIAFPVQYFTGVVEPPSSARYGHAPLALHLHVLASTSVFGGSPTAVRLVPALTGLGALLALLWFCRKHFGSWHAVLAGAIYVALPINAVYTNMVNHSTGFILWTFVFLNAYLRWQSERTRGWLAAVFGAFFMASLWDWPAYTVAGVVAVHWGLGILATGRRAGQRGWLKELGILATFCVWVVAQLGGHVVLVEWLGAGLRELAGIAGKRQQLPWGSFAYQVRVVPALMYTWPILLASFAWVVRLALRARHRPMEARDLAPLAFLVAGTAHYFVFKSSSMVHDYWSWPLVPGVAIASACMLLWLGDLVRAWLSTKGLDSRVATGLVLVLGAAALFPLAHRQWTLVPDGRRTGGSLWFVAPVRGKITKGYASGRSELRFAEQVRVWTTRDTGVLVHDSIRKLQPEPRFEARLDRQIEWSAKLPRVLPTAKGIAGWVFIAVASAIPQAELVEIAKQHPLWLYDRYVMIDYRVNRGEILAYRLVTQRKNLAWWYFVSPWEPPVRVERDLQREATLYAAQTD